MSLVFKRMYIDIPTNTHNKLVKVAAERGVSMKGLVAELIEKECTPAKPKRKRSKK